jgi:hypothetical protein
MRLTGLFMPAFADHLGIPDQHTADTWIRVSGPQAALGKA